MDMRLAPLDTMVQVSLDTCRAR